MPVFDRVNIMVPVMNNEETLQQLMHEVTEALSNMVDKCEFVFVDDASTDGSLGVLEQIAGADPTVQVLANPKNLGQQASIRKGLALCRGDAVVVMDADLQDPPSAIPKLLLALADGPYDAVFATRSGRYQSRARMLSGTVFRYLIGHLTALPKGAGCFVAIRGGVAAQLAAKKNQRFYLAGLIGCGDYRISALPVERSMRQVGRSSYSSSMRWKTGVSNITAVLQERLLNAKR
ncbi:MAG: hypothetical protein COB16_16900 [Rhodobacteraceae bacterium]|nr:MAG: hypothetical protein COB16_16900 [Paracoccaceae bacterium]